MVLWRQEQSNKMKIIIFRRTTYFNAPNNFHLVVFSAYLSLNIITSELAAACAHITIQKTLKIRDIRIYARKISRTTNESWEYYKICKRSDRAVQRTTNDWRKSLVAVTLKAKKFAPWVVMFVYKYSYSKNLARIDDDLSVVLEKRIYARCCIYGWGVVGHIRVYEKDVVVVGNHCCLLPWSFPYERMYMFFGARWRDMLPS